MLESSPGLAVCYAEATAASPLPGEEGLEEGTQERAEECQVHGQAEVPSSKNDL